MKHKDTRPLSVEILRWTSSGHKPEKLDGDHLDSSLNNAEGFLQWIHVSAGSLVETSQFLRESLHISADVVEHMVSAVERPRLSEEKESYLITANAIRLVAPKVFYDRVAFLIRGKLLISLDFGECDVINRWRTRCHESENLVVETPADMMSILLDGIVDDYFPVADHLSQQLDHLETNALTGKDIHNKDILRLKRRLLEMRRNITPMRDVLNSLLRRDLQLVSSGFRGELQDTYDHCFRVIEQIDLNLDLFTTVIDIRMSMISNNLGKSTQLLTVVATVLMSMSLIAGIYGMNFAHMPEINWPWGYAFAIGLMMFIAAIELWYFHKKKWF